MENANSHDYLEKIKIQVIENLRKTNHNSVQMQDTPRTTITGGRDEDDDIADDADEDENMDTRSSQRRNDKRIARDDELDESEDEEENYKNGVRPQSGAIKQRNHVNHQNDNTASDVDMDSRAPTPSARTPASPAQPGVSALPGEVGSNAPSRADTPKPVVDTEGDVDMTDDNGPAEPAQPQSPVSVATPAAEAAAATAAATDLEPAAIKQETEPEAVDTEMSVEVVASEPEPPAAAAVTEANAEVNAEIMERKASESEPRP